MPTEFDANVTDGSAQIAASLQNLAAVKFVGFLRHALRCPDAGCQHLICWKMKKLFEHSKTCQRKKTPQGCLVCRRTDQLFYSPRYKSFWAQKFSRCRQHPVSEASGRAASKPFPILIKVEVPQNTDERALKSVEKILKRTKSYLPKERELRHAEIRLQIEKKELQNPAQEPQAGPMVYIHKLQKHWQQMMQIYRFWLEIKAKIRTQSIGSQQMQMQMSLLQVPAKVQETGPMASTSKSPEVAQQCQDNDDEEGISDLLKGLSSLHLFDNHNDLQGAQEQLDVTDPQPQVVSQPVGQAKEKILNPEKIRDIERYQLLLKLILNAEYCLEIERLWGQNYCFSRLCAHAKHILNHVTACKADEICTTEYSCIHFRLIIQHWDKCTSSSCPLCAPIRRDFKVRLTN